MATSTDITITVTVSHAAQLGGTGTEIAGTLVASDAHTITIDPAERTTLITRQYGDDPVRISRQHIITITRRGMAGLDLDVFAPSGTRRSLIAAGSAVAACRNPMPGERIPAADLFAAYVAETGKTPAQAWAAVSAWADANPV
jgi:hypothetical protein